MATRAKLQPAPAGEQTVVYRGPERVHSTGRTWEPGQAQTVPAECAERVLTHPLFEVVETVPDPAPSEE